MQYLDIADNTYTRNMEATIDDRRDWARLELQDSNTVGKNYLLLKVSHNAVKYPKRGIGGDRLTASIRLHKGQVKKIIKALRKFVEKAEGVTE